MPTLDVNALTADGSPDMRRFAAEQGDRLAAIAAGQADSLAETLTLFSRDELAEAIHLKLRKTFGEGVPLVELSSRLAEAQTASLPAYNRPGDSAAYFTTRRMIAAEERFFDAVRRMAGRGEGLPPHRIAAAVDGFAQKRRERGRGEDEVMEACLRYLLGPGQLKILSGPPGAGKSLLLRAVAEAFAEFERPIFAVAPTDKATESLASDIGIPGIRSADLVSAMRDGSVPAGSLILFDEAGMEGTLQLSEIISLAERNGIELVLAGDHQQIPANTAGEPLRPTVELLSTEPGMPRPVVLDKTYRQNNLGDRAAVMAAFRGQGAESVEYFDQIGGLAFADGEEATLKAAASAYADASHGEPAKQPAALLLTLGDDATEKANLAARRAFDDRGRLGKSKPVRTEATIGGMPSERILPLAAGDRVILTGEIHAEKPGGAQVSLAAGSLATVRRIDGDSIEISLDGSKSYRVIRRSDSTGRDIPMPLTYGYALDVKTAQGMTTKNAVLAVTGEIDAAHFLVGVSRHTNALQVMVNHEVYENTQQLGDAASLHKTKRMVYDFAPAAAP